MQRRTFIASLSFLGLMGCASASGLTDIERPQMDRSYDLQGLNFSALPDLSVSEDNSIYPFADVVWRGDPPGPRVAQIGALFQEAATRNAAVINGTVPVVVDVTLVRFHGVTDRTRFSIGGVYNVIFDMTVRNATTGVVIEPTRRVEGNLRGEEGTIELGLDARGSTQRARVVDFLTTLLRAQLI